MKRLNLVLLLSIAAVVFLTNCAKKEEVNAEGTFYLDYVEDTLSIEAGQSIYSEEGGNIYYSIRFNADTLSHVYGVYVEQGKKYNLSISGGYCGPVDFLLLSAQNDVMFYGEQGDVGFSRKYITWVANTTGLVYISLKYNENINFHVYEYFITFEELTINTLHWNNITLQCSGEWFVNSENQLSLACHGSSFSKWAKIVDDDLINYELNVKVGLKSGVPNIYTGLAFYASQDIFDMVNIPKNCYEFKIKGPSTWEQWTWNGSVGRTLGQTSVSLNSGIATWNEMHLKTMNDSVFVGVNDETVNRFRNTYFLDHGLYLVVDDQKKDTVCFKELQIVN